MINKNILENKKIIIFDMDGTLIDSIGVWNEVDIATVEFYTGTRPSEEEVNKLRDYSLANSPDTDIYKYYISKLCEKYSIHEDIDVVYEKRKWFGDEIPKRNVKLKNNVKELLIILKEKGYILALATTSTISKIKIYSYENENTKVVNFIETFDLILTKDEVINKKPHPEVLDKVLAHFNEIPEKAIVFEDSYVGVLAAKNAGIEVVAVYDKYSDYEREKINELADYKIDDFKEIIDII